MAETATLSAAQLGSRALFPDLAPRAYLAHAAISPPSLAVRDSVGAYLRQTGQLGVLGFGQSLEQRERVRTRLAHLMGAASADSLAFVQNTGSALAAVATSVAFRPGERIILFEGEYPSNVHVFCEMAKRCGAEVCFLDADEYLHDEQSARAALERQLERGARLLSVSAVQFQTGYRMPLEWIGQRCKAHGTLLCVDAVQGLGAVPLDVQTCHVDFLACGGHKWLMGLDGIGVLYVNPTALAVLSPVLVGSMSYEDAMRMLMGEADQLRYDRPLLPSARLFEGGMLSSVSLAALDASTACIEWIGVENIFAHVQRYHDALEHGVVELGFTSLRSGSPEARSATLSFLPPTGIAAGPLSEALQAQGVIASCPDGCLRLAPHWPNDLEEVPHVLDAIFGACRALG